MRLPGSTALLAASFALAACGDAMSPPKVVTKRVYALEKVSGRPVPAVVDSGPIEIYSVLDGTLTLESNDSSISQLHAITSSPQYGEYETNVTTRGEYKIVGDSIQVGFFGACRDICAPNRIGAYGDSTLTLTNEIRIPSAPVYLYRLVPDLSK